jgi:ABC-type proline/glycine betaine transport system permease subunit
LLAGVVVGVLLSWLRRRQLERDGVPGSGAFVGVIAFLVVAVIGYFVTASSASMPSATAYELRRGDRGTLFEDINGNGAFEPGVDRTLAYVSITLFDGDGQVLATGMTDGDGTFRFIDLPAEAVRLEWDTPTPLAISEPQRQGFNFRGGLSMTPEFAALLLALVVYTGAFIAEIVRAGINAVNKGQWEASRALGLSTSDTLRMVVLPQALRVIIFDARNICGAVFCRQWIGAVVVERVLAAHLGQSQTLCCRAVSRGANVAARSGAAHGQRALRAERRVLGKHYAQPGHWPGCAAAFPGDYPDRDAGATGDGGKPGVAAARLCCWFAFCVSE